MANDNINTQTGEDEGSSVIEVVMSTGTSGESGSESGGTGKPIDEQGNSSTTTIYLRLRVARQTEDDDYTNIEYIVCKIGYWPDSIGVSQLLTENNPTLRYNPSLSEGEYDYTTSTYTLEGSTSRNLLSEISSSDHFFIWIQFKVSGKNLRTCNNILDINGSQLLGSTSIGKTSIINKDTINVSRFYVFGGNYPGSNS